MTDQERPVEERNELLDDLLTAATPVAMDEQDQSQQPAVDEQPEPAAQPVAASPAKAPTSAASSRRPTGAAATRSTTAACAGASPIAFSICSMLVPP